MLKLFKLALAYKWSGGEWENPPASVIPCDTWEGLLY